ncbi:C-GCAxxG-C-C family protein [Chakrabartyella piscis]|uniref:C-GCAxxG-C-C family protein n=1 Tax=Chakrabartyella piscis TaxID=2918914 RepID=UPI00295888F4|nr:C-GCAxxG-C-C family protein [Chakrabartyella piscis]
MSEIQEIELTLVEQTALDGANYFRQGLNCTECVLMSFRDNCNPEIPMEAFAMCTGFGGGFANTRNHTCGAITGAIMAYGSIIGRKNPFAKEEMRDKITELHGIYHTMEPMIREMEAEFGDNFICKDLSAVHGDFEGKARKRNCMQMVKFCSGVAAKYAELAKKEQGDCIE